MNGNHFKKTGQDDRLEVELQKLKAEYQQVEMSEAQLATLKKTMEAITMGKNEKAEIAEAAETKTIKTKEDAARKKETARIRKFAMAAVVAGVLIVLPNTSATIAYAMEQVPILGRLVEVVTLRDYRYETERNHADIEVPQFIVDQEGTENLKQTTEELNAEIQALTNEIIQQFESDLENREGYQDVVVKGEVLTQNEDYFTLKLLCYQGAGSGYQWNYYYTIDLHTGERMQLKDLFQDNADYISPISENIKEQMRTQMKEDDMAYYWLDGEVEEWNFKSITDDTNFYINDAGNIVIGFNEGDVAPMYMGAVEFEIPADVVSDIRK